MKLTDYQKVRELAENILKEDKKMIQVTSELDSRLKSLKGSFLDDGINEVDAYVKELTSRLKEAQASFLTIAAGLKEYANLLQQGK